MTTPKSPFHHLYRDKKIDFDETTRIDEDFLRWLDMPTDDGDLLVIDGRFDRCTKTGHVSAQQNDGRQRGWDEFGKSCRLSALVVPMSTENNLPKVKNVKLRDAHRTVTGPTHYRPVGGSGNR